MHVFEFVLLNKNNNSATFFDILAIIRRRRVLARDYFRCSHCLRLPG